MKRSRNTYIIEFLTFAALQPEWFFKDKIKTYARTEYGAMKQYRKNWKTVGWCVKFDIKRMQAKVKSDKFCMKLYNQMYALVYDDNCGMDIVRIYKEGEKTYSKSKYKESLYKIKQKANGINKKLVNWKGGRQ